jgi:hypothetical protein
VPAAVGLAGATTAACGFVCPPGEAGPLVRTPESGPAPSCWRAGVGLTGKVVSAPCAAFGALCCRPAGARSIIDDAIVRANFPFRRAVLIGSEGCTASAFETCYGY